MTPDKDKLLCEKYPKIFKNRNSSVQESCMSCGFECEDGWFNLIDTLCSIIQNHVDWKTKNSSPEDSEDLQPVADQVKSKFGGLRFYVSGGDDTISGMIIMAESLSFKICEECGNVGSKKGRGWIFTMCDNCWESHPCNKIHEVNENNS